MVDLRPEYCRVLNAMSETEPSTPEQLAEKTGSIHMVILAIASLHYDGLIDIRSYRRTVAGSLAIERAERGRTAISFDALPQATQHETSLPHRHSLPVSAVDELPFLC